MNKAEGNKEFKDDGVIDWIGIRPNIELAGKYKSGGEINGCSIFLLLQNSGIVNLTCLNLFAVFEKSII